MLAMGNNSDGQLGGAAGAFGVVAASFSMPA